MMEDKKIAPVIIGLLLIIISIGFAAFSLLMFSSENIDRMVLWIPIITIVSMFFRLFSKLSG
jgi:ABC-type Na+ efflux pump permease subunit